MSRSAQQIIDDILNFRAEPRIKCTDVGCSLVTHPLFQPVRMKGIYGTADTRFNVSESLLAKFEEGNDKSVSVESERLFARNARASCMIVNKNQLSKRIDNQGGVWYNIYSRTYGPTNGLCRSELFYDEPVVGYCSGINIDDHVLSAGHCSQDIPPEEIAFLFNYRLGTDGTFPTRLSADNVAFAEKVVVSEYTDTEQDYTVLKMDRPSPFALSMKDIPISKSTKEVKVDINIGEKVYIIGNPYGLPQKCGKGSILHNPSNNYFVTNLSSYKGNSGSPVFNAETNDLLGLLVRGDVDFDTDEARGCQVSKMCSIDAQGCAGEDVCKLDVIFAAYRKSLQ